MPYRIFDTRLDAFPGPSGGAIHNYYVHDSGAFIGPQGGNAGGCSSPKGEPSAIAANFTLVPFGKGHIRVWPFGRPQPNASFLNYNTPVNSNLANAGVIATRYIGGRDISVSTHFGAADPLADVMGYFYAVNDQSHFTRVIVGLGKDAVKVPTAALHSAARAASRRLVVGNAQGRLLAELTWDGDTAVTDTNWKVSPVLAPGWETVGFDDSGWQLATA